jgi:hypothetical protein|tara:strand:- start:526 stop:753 length:228 start_codon:yes stop_codon:yes gene_type:complete
MANQNPIEYWKAAGIRALRTFVQTALGVLIANQTGMFETDVIMSAAVAGGAAVVSLIQNALEDAPFPFMSNIPKG